MIVALLSRIATAEPNPEPPLKPSGLRLAGLVVGGIGVTAVGFGVALGIHAHSRSDEVTRSPVWDQDLFDSGEAADRNAKILIGVGAAAAAGGVVMYMLGRKHDSEARSVSVTPTRGGAAVVWSCEL